MFESVTPWREASVVETSKSLYAKLHPVPIRSVKMKDGFWKKRMDANREKGIPELYRLLEEHGVLDNLRRISGRKDIARRGAVWTDSDLAKWMEAVSFALQSEDEPKLRKLLDSAIDDLVAIQSPDGYINSFFAGDLANQRFRNLAKEHELYCAGHIFQAAIAHYRATGERKFLEAASKYADYLTKVFGAGKIEQADGHPEIEMALVELYRTTGEKKYLELAGFFLSIQRYSEKETIEGHAVRACYLAAGAADYYAETGEEKIMHALERVWEDMVNHKMYITGGIGARSAGEAFGEPYELPNEQAYAETCAAVASIYWNWRMLAIKGEARFADVMERTLYNGFLSGVSLDGWHYFYTNPLACYKEYQRVPWFDCTCCPTNVVRMIASIPGYFYSTSEEGVWVHLYDNSRLNWRLESGCKFTLEQETNYPWSRNVDITISPEKETEFTLFLRIPGWCCAASVAVNDEAMRGAVPGEYLQIERKWAPGDCVHLELPVDISLQEADPRVREDLGCVAVQRGPVVYCIESVDNPDVPVRDVE
ncbi:MAG: glycoside hydrolase family 127 protein, partial [Armatimonadota bacterium]|nr:glycoside hydrolase family 127 protein [Armatimonadota bacterium]